MVAGTLASGESVAVMARHYGLNANQLFHWRKQYQAGLLGIAKRDGTESDVLQVRRCATRYDFLRCLRCDLMNLPIRD
jgi:transposase-like protein